MCKLINRISWRTFILYFITIQLEGINGSSISMSSKASERLVCSYYRGSEVLQAAPALAEPHNVAASAPANKEILVEGGRSVQCSRSSDFCYSYWKYDGEVGNSSAVILMASGCWFNHDGTCNQSVCEARISASNTFFCCCTGAKCNSEVFPPQPTLAAPTVISQSDSVKNETDSVSRWLWPVLTCLLFSVCIAGFAMMTRRWRMYKPVTAGSGKAKGDGEEGFGLNGNIVDGMQLLESIGCGRYGTVWHSHLQGTEVAVKLFAAHSKKSFENERYIYTRSLMEHPNLLKYLGGGEFLDPQTGVLCYGLVLSYCPRGRLNTYLQENTLDWATFCHIALTATRGLAHLHADVRRGDMVKPCISHRDFNTRNLLLQNDLSCVVADLNFAIHTKGAQYYVDGEEQHAETASLTDVGTLRYMAPEVLEGAVNLRDCEAALKQIDMYALGLVLWECAARCQDLYQGMQTPVYAMPYQAEIGQSPTFEQVQVLVARNKARPLFPSVWKDSNHAVQLLKETIEDCWDHDAEARLSAMCVEGRILELPALWERHKGSLNLNGVSASPGNHFLGCTANHPESGTPLPLYSGGRLSNALTSSEKDTSFSENTTDTTLTASPTVDVRSLNKNLLVSCSVPMAPIQAYQGSNPCQERNLNSESDEPSFRTPLVGLTKVDLDLMTTASLRLADVAQGQPQLSRQLARQVPERQMLLDMSNTHQISPPPSLSLPPISFVQNAMSRGPAKVSNVAQEQRRVTSGSPSNLGSWGGRVKASVRGGFKFFLPSKSSRVIGGSGVDDLGVQEVLVTGNDPSPLMTPTVRPHLKGSCDDQPLHNNSVNHSSCDVPLASTGLTNHRQEVLIIG